MRDIIVASQLPEAFRALLSTRAPGTGQPLHLLVAAVTSTGIRSPMHRSLECGPRPLLVILVALILAALAAGLLIQ